MKYSNALPWLPALLVLSACPGKPPAPELSGVSITCTPATVVAGQSAQCTASATDQNGEPFSVSGYTWTSSDETVAKVDATGKASTQVLSSGPVVIRASATAGDITRSAEATLNVTPKDPTVHSTPITASETWREAGNPHLVRGQLVVDGAATLTLEPGVVVRFASDAELRVTNGALVARGTQTAPILLQTERGAASGSWRGLVFFSRDSASTLEHVTVSGCGAAAGEGACISVRNRAAPVLRDVSVRESASVGVLVAEDGSAFGAGSARLSVSGSTGYAVRMGANQADSLPTGGSFTGSTPKSSSVELNGHVSRTQTWPNPGVPFVIPGQLKVDHPTAEVTLTISAGTRLRFGANARLDVGTGEVESFLKVDGKAGETVLFTADADSPMPGHWRGVHIRTRRPNAGHLSHAIIEYAGAAPVDPGEYYYLSGNLNLYSDYSANPTVVLTDVVVRRGKGPGIDMVEFAGFGQGSARVTASENGTYPLVITAPFVHTIPADSRLTGNKDNAVLVEAGRLESTQTWPNLGLPYLIASTVRVGHSTSNPTLTLLPGTELRFQPGGAIVVGWTEDGPAVLLAQGKVDAPIRFVPDVLPAPVGYWGGVHLWNANGSRLDHVYISHGGIADKSGTNGVLGTGNLNVHREMGAFVTNSRFHNARQCPIAVSLGDFPGTTRVTTQFFSPEYNNNGANNGPDNDVDYQCFYDI
jgi:hypothetical protein